MSNGEYSGLEQSGNPTASDFLVGRSATAEDPLELFSAAGAVPLSLDGTPDYLTLSGQVLTLGLIDLTADVTGLLPSANIVDEYVKLVGDIMSGILTITIASSGGSADSTAVLTLEDSGSATLQILSGASSIGGILFGDSGGPTSGSIQYNHSTDSLFFSTTNTSRVSIDSSGIVTILEGLTLDKLFTTPSAGELTISSGSITPIGMYHTVDTESDDATDDLDTIVNPGAGSWLILTAANASRTVVVKDGTTIQLSGGADFSLTNLNDTLFLFARTGTRWVEISRSTN